MNINFAKPDNTVFMRVVGLANFCGMPLGFLHSNKFSIFTLLLKQLRTFAKSRICGQGVETPCCIKVY
jgi:hypothetical protein